MKNNQEELSRWKNAKKMKYFKKLQPRKYIEAKKEEKDEISGHVQRICDVLLAEI